MSTDIKCPDCGNTNQDRFAPAARGAKAYCLECHYSFKAGTITRKEQRATGRRSALTIDFEISVLKNRIQYLELEKSRIIAGLPYTRTFA